MKTFEDKRTALIQLPYAREQGSRKVLWIITDIHLLSPSLYRVGEGSFSFLHQHNLGKLFEAMPQAMKEFRELALSEHPDYVIIPGDLVLNGEAESLFEIEELLSDLEAQGIHIAVIPGNHDIDSPYPYSFLEEEPAKTDPVSYELFMERIGRFGYCQAFSKAPATCSYALAIDETLWLLALDANTGEVPNTIDPSTLAWAKGILEEAEKKQINVISLTHQNVLPQSTFMIKGFVLANAEEVRDLLVKYHVALNLCGHSHLQHRSQYESLTDICIGAACVWPLGFSVLAVDETNGECLYQKREFSDHQEAAIRRMEELIERLLARMQVEEGCGEEEKAEMIRFADEVVRRNFSDMLEDRESYLSQPGWQLWNKYGKNDPSFRQLSSILLAEEGDAHIAAGVFSEKNAG